MARLVSLCSSRDRPVRSVWSGTPILTLPVNAKAERMLGVKAISLVFNSYFITQDFDVNLSKFSSNRIVAILLRYLVFIWCCCWYDRFHFFMDMGFIPQALPGRFNERELRLYAKLGKQVFLYAYGADVRTRQLTHLLGTPNCCTECPSPALSCICNDTWGDDNLVSVRKYATAYFSMGDMLEYTPGSYNTLYYWPIDLSKDRYQPSYPPIASNRPVKIVHAPNHRGFKGTRYIIEAIDVLRNEGIDVELHLVEKMPNEQALEVYRSADILFDQCIIGFHGYFALEGMAMGKPVICFIRKPESYLISYQECPILNTSIETLTNDLRMLVTDRKRLHELGRQGRAYVEQYFSLEAFASRLKEAYDKLGIVSK
ncbi:MAG: glycosyltransferase [Smithella sp.]